MKLPFCRGSSDQVIPREWAIRLQNVLHDKEEARSHQTYFAVDFFWLFCHVLRSDHDLESFLARRILFREPARYLVFPETLWELRKEIDARARKCVGRQEAVDAFVRCEEVREFLRLMSASPIVWSEVLGCLSRVFAAERLRVGRQTVVELAVLRGLEGAIKQLEDHLSSGLLVTESQVLALLECTDAWDGAEFDETRIRAFSQLTAQRGRQESDWIDATVYAKILWLNRHRKHSKLSRVHFLSHESMVEYLESCSLDAEHRYVRSFTDTWLVRTLTSNLPAGVPGCQADTLKEVRSLEKMATELASGAGEGAGGKQRVERGNFEARVRKLGRVTLAGWPLNDSPSGAGLSGLLQQVASDFERTVRDASAAPVGVEDIVQVDRERIEYLFMAIAYLSATPRMTLEEFMAPVLKAGRECLLGGDGSSSLRLQQLVEMIGTPSDKVDWEEVYGFLLVAGLSENDLSQLEEAVRTRRLQTATSDAELMEVWAFVKRISKVQENVRRSQARGGETYTAEILRGVEQLANGEWEGCERIRDAVVIGGEPAKAFAIERLEAEAKRVADPGLIHKCLALIHMLTVESDS